jgi:hypothetical protein
MKFVLAKWRANMFGEWDSMHKGAFERLLLVASERDSCDSVSACISLMWWTAE